MKTLHGMFGVPWAAASAWRGNGFGCSDGRHELAPTCSSARDSGGLFYTQGTQGGLMVDKDARWLEGGVSLGSLAAGNSGHGPSGLLGSSAFLAASGFGHLADDYQAHENAQATP